jgi:hypothetical protein
MIKKFPRRHETRMLIAVRTVSFPEPPDCSPHIYTFNVLFNIIPSLSLRTQKQLRGRAMAKSEVYPLCGGHFV